MRNPLRSEGDAFHLLLYVIAVFGTIIAIILIVRALT
jgi:nitrogen fixation protein FixH